MVEMSKVVCTKAPGRMWASTEVRPRGKQSPLSENSDTAKRVDCRCPRPRRTLHSQDLRGTGEDRH